MATLDHIIVPVADIGSSVRFYTDVLGFDHEGQDGPFSVIRVNEGLTLQLAPWGTEGGMHLAFELSPAEFESTFGRIKAAGVPFGDTFHDAENGRGPGREFGARGPGAALYLFDPSRHLLEIRHYGG